MKIDEEPIIEYQTKFNIVSAKTVSGYKIQILFNNGTENIIDFESFFSNSQHPSIRKYLDPAKFKQFKIVNGNLNWNDYDMIFPLSDLRNRQIT